MCFPGREGGKMVGSVASASMPSWGGENMASKSSLMHGLREGGGGSFLPKVDACGVLKKGIDK